MKDYATVPNTTGAFPNVVSKNTTGSGATDGTPYFKQVVDDLWGARQALMDRVALAPNGSQESASASQFLDALDLITRRNATRIINWSKMPFATTADDFLAVAYVEDISGIEKNRWVAVGEKTANSGIWSSRGGMAEWTERVNPATGAFLTGVIWDPINSLFVAVGFDDAGDADILTSPDGITWTERANPKAFDLYSVASNGSDLLVAVGEADGTDAYIVTSPDGITWTERANPKNFTLLSVIYGPTLSLFCAVGILDGSDAYIVTSPDGITWTERANASNLGLNSVAWGNGRFVAVGDNNGSNSPYILESTDGITWNVITLTELGDTNSRTITYSIELSRFIAVADELDADGSPMIFYSLDGLSWEVAYLPIESYTLRAIRTGANGATIVGSSGLVMNSQRW